MIDDVTLPILYSFRRCPYAMRARMALAHAGIRCEIREVVLRDKPSSMLALSPKGEVPVLAHGGRVVEESIDIMRWALSPNDDWLRFSADVVAQMDDLVSRCEVGFKPWLDRYKYADRHPDHSKGYSRAQAEIYLRDLEKRLEGHRFLVADRLSFADVAVMPFVRQFAHVDLNWFQASDYPYLNHWLEHLKTGELFLSIMTKYPQWREGDQQTMFDVSHARMSL